MSLRLVGIQGARTGLAVPVSGTEISFGRETSNTVSFDGDSQVSRRHARILISGPGLLAEDLGSTNGTLVNGVRIAGPTPLQPGDTIQVGGNVFRLETAFADAPKRVEVSSPERGKRGQRKAELSGTVEPLYKGPPSGPLDNFNGCAMPSVDLSGCWKILLYILILLIIAAVIGGLVMLASMGIGALGAHGTAGSPGGMGAGGSGGGTGGQSQPAPQNQPQQDQQRPPPQGGQETNTGLQIIEVRVTYAKRDGVMQPVVLVKWKNGTEQLVNKLMGSVRVYDRDGKLLKELKDQKIYVGEPVVTGEVHEDTAQEGGIPLSTHFPGIPSKAEVTVEHIQ